MHSGSNFSWILKRQKKVIVVEYRDKTITIAFSTANKRSKSESVGKLLSDLNSFLIFEQASEHE